MRRSSVVAAAGLVWLCVAGVSALGWTPVGSGQGAAPAPAAFRVLSWNVSGDAFVRLPAAFQAHLQIARAEILLFDEVGGTLGAPDLAPALKALGEKPPWQVSWGKRGGRQRGVIATRLPFEQVTAFQENQYPEAIVQEVMAGVPLQLRDRVRDSLAAGIPVNGGIVRIGNRSVLVVIVDVECCGASWQQVRRMGEVREIRRLVAEALERYRPDAIVLAGDFNLASPPAGQPGVGALPLIVLSGVYPAPYHALLAAEAYHRDGKTAWTIHGSGTPFPSLPFDFQLYSPHSLRVVDATVISSATLPPGDLTKYGLTSGVSQELSEHLPVVVGYEFTGTR